MKKNELKKGDANFRSTLTEKDLNTKKKRCSKCGKYKLLKEFSRRNDRPGGVQSSCKKCFKVYSSKLTKKRQLKENTEAYRKYNREYYYTPKGKIKAKRNNLYMYGLTLEQWEDMVRKQKGLCAICKSPMSPPHIDHDHELHKVRELLCGLCNSMLGFARENPDILRRGARYIIKHKEKK